MIVPYLKTKLRICKIQIQKEKVCFVAKKKRKMKFLIFFSKGGPFEVNTVKNIFFDFSKISKKNLKMTFLGPFNHRKEQSQEFWLA